MCIHIFKSTNKYNFFENLIFQNEIPVRKRTQKQQKEINQILRYKLAYYYPQYYERVNVNVKERRKATVLVLLETK